MNTTKLFPGKSVEDNSGVHKIKDVKRSLEKSRQHFADITETMQRDELLGPLLRGGFHNGKRQEGLLRSVIYRFNKFYDASLLKQEDFLNKEMILRRLETEFATAMKDVIALWPRLSSQGVEWNDICASLESYFVDLGSIFGLENQVSFFVRNWFDTYARNHLNAQALEAYQALAYSGATGGRQTEEIAQIRRKIMAIDQKLATTPLAPAHYPAFSKHNPSAKVLIKPGNPRAPQQNHLVVTMGRSKKVTAKPEKYPSPWVEPPQKPPAAAKKKQWWKFWK